LEVVTPRVYSIQIEPAAWRELMRLPEKVQEAVFNAIYRLEAEPRPSGCKKLQGKTGFYRIRVGDFRVVYDVQDGILVVIIVAVGDRKDIYD
jgi:mRNA interferase RelE/StbE